MDAKCAPAQPEHDPILESEGKESAANDDLPIEDLWKDFEFKRLAAMYRLLKSDGYALRPQRSARSLPIRTPHKQDKRRRGRLPKGTVI